VALTNGQLISRSSSLAMNYEDNRCLSYLWL
jgi:hypothetical protein